MKLKRALALLLSGTALCSLLVLPGPARAAQVASTAFTDIQDQNMAEAAETLRLLGVVNGTGDGAFQPGRTLTRAEFCKMAVELMGNGDKAAAQMNRTIFQDVPSTHWARGYIAVATQALSGTGAGDDSAPAGIIRGDAYGNFHPDRSITYAEAVTILVRILGYSDTDVGLIWPAGYLAKADELGISDGLNLSATAAPTRGQTAVLMENLLFADDKGGKEYLASLGCTQVDETVVFDVAAIAPDGGSAIEVSDGKVYKTGHAPFDEDLLGRRAKLILDPDDKVIAIQPSRKGTTKVVDIQSLAYDSIKVPGGGGITVKDPDEVLVWQPDEDETTYDKLYLSGAAAGTQAVLQYSAAGKLEYIFLRSSAQEDGATQVVKNNPSYSGQESYTVYKNGAAATTKDIRRYDVTTFNKSSNTLYVSDVRVTGVYENVYPNLTTPAKVRVLGHDFEVLSRAAADLRSFKLGESVTLLLDYYGRVAGAISPTVARSSAVGRVDSIDASSGEASVTAINLRENGRFVTLTGATSYKGNRAQEMTGQLVTISSGGKGKLSLTKLSGGANSSRLDVSSWTMGSTKLSDNVRLYEKVGSSQLAEIQREDITVQTVPSSQITYVHTDYAGRADMIVFDDVTGDRYTYGLPKTSLEKESLPSLGDGDSETTVSIRYLQVINAQHLSGSDALIYQENVRANAPIGVVEGAIRTDGKRTVGKVVELLKREVRSDAFDMDSMTVALNDMVLPVAENVQCYNESTGQWFSVGSDAGEEEFKAALNKARAFSETVTIYYDKSPDQGGKVRLVMAE